MQNTYDFLKILTKILPPPPGKNHSIVLSHFKENELYLTVWVKEEATTFYLDEEDFVQEPEILVKQIFSMCENHQ